jgi:multicomponent Na+:H+ antiporter subunit G
MIHFGDIFLVVGALFIALGSLGLIRMPDVYNRLQAGTKSSTLGAMSLLLGIGFHHPDWWPKLLVIAGFVLFTNPVGSSAVARAARIAGIKPWRAEEKPGSDEKG